MINVYPDTDTEEVYNVVQAGAPYDLDAKSITKVEIYVCNNLSKLTSESEAVISSDDGYISWVADVLTIKFGYLGVVAGKYKAKVRFYNEANPLGFVVQEIPIKVVC